jgi:hypothetical protein
MVMLVTLVSGLGIHRWNIKDMFVFRPWSSPNAPGLMLTTSPVSSRSRFI